MIDAPPRPDAVPTSRVLVELHPGDSLDFVGHSINVQVIAKSGRAARLCITAPRNMKIARTASDTSMAGSLTETRG